MNWRNILGKVGIKITKKVPVDITIPKPFYQYYKDKGNVLLGYSLQVTYLDSTVEDILFATDEDKFGLVSRRKALKNAADFYKKMVVQIHERQM